MFCIFASLYYAFDYKFNKHDFDYLDVTMDGTKFDSVSINFVVTFGTWLLIFGRFIPISLIITLETVKIF